jgi:hypothetical protein
MTWSVQEQETRVNRREVRKVLGKQLKESYSEMLSTPLRSIFLICFVTSTRLKARLPR